MMGRHSRPHRPSSRHRRSHPSSRNSFIVPIDKHGRAVVAMNRKGQWMILGGQRNHGESAERAAVRELMEESGFRPGSGVRHILTKDGTSLFRTRFRDGSRSSRNRRFHNRTDTNETSDYGFVDLHNPEYIVTNYDGTRKNVNPTHFRRGSVSHLNAIRHARRRR